MTDPTVIRSGDSAYVSREPSVIAQCRPPADCPYRNEYCRRCDVPENEEHRRGQG